MLQNARVIAFTVSELLKENQQGLFWEEGGKITPTPLLYLHVTDCSEDYEDKHGQYGFRVKNK